MRLVRHLREYRYVLSNFILRDLKVKYRGTVLGYLWSLLEPMALVSIYYYLFRFVFQRGDEDYPLVVILGVLPYGLLSSIVTTSATALTGSAALIRRVYLPREIFVLGAVGSNLVTFLLSMLAVVPFLIVYEVKPTAQLAIFPFAVLLLALFSTGIGFVVSCANVIYRDVGYIIRVLIRILFYLSPVIYTASMVPSAYKDLLFLNPIAVYLSLIRDAVLGRDLTAPLSLVALATALALLSFFLGAKVFYRWERAAVKYL